jgi:hypothetical protein
MATTKTPTAKVPRDVNRARRTVAVAVVLGGVPIGASYPFLGATAVAIIALFAVSFIPWCLTNYGRPADPSAIVVPYLVTVILFLVQFGEEYQTEIWLAFTRIGHPLTERTFVVAAGTIVPIFWLLGLVLLCLRTELGNWMAWVFAIAMGLMELSHLVFPFMDTGHFGYFPGLYGSLLLVPAGWYLAFRLSRAAQGKNTGFKGAFLWVLAHTLNPIAIRGARAGRGPFALMRHVGRKTGRAYETPLVLAPVKDGFIAELTYGDQVAWYRNVVAAAGQCVVVFKGVEYQIDGMEPYPTDEGGRAFGFPQSLVLRLLRREEFRLLHIATTRPPSQSRTG